MGNVRSSAPDVVAAHPVHGLGKIGKILKLHPVPGVPEQVLVAEMVDRTDFIAGLCRRLHHMARGKTGNEDPASHNSSVCFPAFEGTIRIFASGNW